MAIAGDTEAGSQYAGCHFFRLPAELRVEIHQLALTRNGLCRISFGDQRPHPSEHMTQLSDFLVCKKWFSEAYPEYLKHNTFAFNSIEDLKQFAEGHEITRSSIQSVCFTRFWDAYMMYIGDFFYGVSMELKYSIKTLPPLPALVWIGVHCLLVSQRRLNETLFEIWESGVEEVHESALDTLKQIDGVQDISLRTETLGPFSGIVGPTRVTSIRKGRPEQDFSRTWRSELS